MQAITQGGRKRGRLPNLARFYREQAAELSKPIVPLNICWVNDPEWFMRTQQVVLDLRNGVARQYAGVTPAMVAHIDTNIPKIEVLPIGHKFVAGLGTERKYPDLQTSGIRRDRAIELSQALLDVARRNPYLVRHGVLGYLYAVGKRMQVLIADQAYASYGRVLIDIVEQVVERLDSPWLGWRLTGFKVDRVKADPASWLIKLGLDSGTTVFYENAKAANNPVELDHIRIDVCLNRGENRRQSREFYEVMMLAAVTELWKCVEQ